MALSSNEAKKRAQACIVYYFKKYAEGYFAVFAYTYPHNVSPPDCL